MKEAKRTPGPWERSKDTPLLITAGAITVADARWEILGYEAAEANADFIVRACNSHDELVEALKDAGDWLHALLEEYPTIVNDTRMQRLFAALAGADEKLDA